MKPIGHNVTHSTWNPSTLSWDYWRAPMSGLRDGVIAKPPQMRRSQFGVAPEEAERPLPIGAAKVGSGPVARGQVARRGLGGLPLTVDTGRILLIGAAAFLIYHLWSTR